MDPCGSAAHPVGNALAVGDLDRAFALGLMDAIPCPACSADCVARLDRVQGERQQALAARERYRQREARLARRRLEREQRRAAPTVAVEDQHQPAASAVVTARPFEAPRVVSPALPPAAAAALARAQAKAAARAQGTTSPGSAALKPPSQGEPER
ncbi:hypothetical protein TI01_0317 [Lysobacter sp. A03]|nr:hypothetical protein TI01_0317 [Lysobacter sp. A03]